jgi:hypothetical protein
MYMKSSLFWGITAGSPFKGKKQPELWLPTCFHAGFLFGRFFHPEDGGDAFL